MEKYKLKRPLKDHNGNEIKELNIKGDDEISALDYYEMEVEYDMQTGQPKETLGSMREPIANMAGITSSQVDSLHPADFIRLSGIVGKYLI